MSIPLFTDTSPDAERVLVEGYLASLWLDPQTMKQAFGREPPEGDK